MAQGVVGAGAEARCGVNIWDLSRSERYPDRQWKPEQIFPRGVLAILSIEISFRFRSVLKSSDQREQGQEESSSAAIPLWILVLFWNFAVKIALRLRCGQ